MKDFIIDVHTELAKMLSSNLTLREYLSYYLKARMYTLFFINYQYKIHRILVVKTAKNDPDDE